MARFMRLDVLNKMIELGLVPVFYNADVEVAKKIVAACSAGGAKVVRYGNTRRHVLGLEVVLANGERIDGGGRRVTRGDGFECGVGLAGIVVMIAV